MVERLKRLHQWTGTVQILQKHRWIFFPKKEAFNLMVDDFLGLKSLAV